MKLLLTDNSNAIGRALEHELERETFNVIVPTAAELDWSNESAVVQYLRLLKPDVVVNCLGWDDNPDLKAQTRIVQSATHLAAACAPNELPLIHLSSYRVFGGDNKSIHNEKDPPAPLSPAGQAFLHAEEVLARQLQKWVVLRLSWVVGSYGENHLTRILEPLLQGKPLVANRRLRGAPTALSDAARVAVALAKQIVCGADNWGVMHYCSGDACTEVEFAEQVINTLQQQELLTSPAELVTVDQASETEPVSAVLSCRRVRDGFGVQARSWRPSLLPMIKQWAHNNALAD